MRRSSCSWMAARSGDDARRRSRLTSQGQRSRPQDVGPGSRTKETHMLLTGDILIGATRSAGSGASLRAIDPATGETLEPAFAVAGATRRSTAPARSPRTPSTPIRETSLGSARRVPRDDRRQYPRDRGRPRRPGLRGIRPAPRPDRRRERMRTVGQLKLFAGVVRAGLWLDLRVDTALPDRKPLPRSDLQPAPHRARTRRGLRRQQLSRSPSRSRAATRPRPSRPAAPSW